MILIAADVGNSATKIVVDRLDDSPTSTQPIKLPGGQPIRLDLPDPPAFWSICSVNSLHCKQLCSWIAEYRPHDQVHEIVESDIPICSNVDCRATTGRDRLVVAWQACCLFDNQRPIVVVDAGTAVTIDWIDVNRVFQGGVIFPGAAASLRALSLETSALPDLSLLQHDFTISEIMAEVLGRSTPMGILRGVFQSQLASMKSIVESMCSSHDGRCNVIATGGGVQRLADSLPDDWSIEQDLVLQGALGIGRILLSTRPETDDCR